jgi:hypothetical protein
MALSVHAPRVVAVAFAAAVLQPALAHAEKIWDVGDFDNCSKAAEDRYMTPGPAGSDPQTFADEIKFCCIRSGGEWHNTQGCTAPAARAEENRLRGGLPPVAVDVGSAERPSLPAIAPGPAAGDPAPQQPMPTPVVRDHR